MAIRLSNRDWEALKQKNPHMNITPIFDSPQPPLEKEPEFKELVVPVKPSKTVYQSHGVCTMTMDELKLKLTEIDELVQSSTITEERGQLWKARIIDEFERSAIPSAVEKKLPNDLSHLPGRIIAGAIDVMKAIAKGSGATYEGLSKQYERGNSKNRVSQPGLEKKSKNILDIYNDLPEEYK